jgi:hypothetical protein
MVHCIRSVAGNWLFSGRRWRNPHNTMDREALDAGYDALVATFPDFSRCSRDHFLATISGFCASWSRSTRNILPDPSDGHPTPTDDESPPRHDDGDGSSGPRLESEAADLRAQRRLARPVGTDYPLHLGRGLGAGPSGLEHSGGTAAPEVIRARLDFRPCSSVQVFFPPLTGMHWPVSCAR